jgi:hypothetical protein
MMDRHNPEYGVESIKQLKTDTPDGELITGIKDVLRNAEVIHDLLCKFQERLSPVLRDLAIPGPSDRLSISSVCSFHELIIEVLNLQELTMDRLNDGLKRVAL